MFGLNVLPYTHPTGQLAGRNNYNYPFRKTEEEYFKKHHKNHTRNDEGVTSSVPHQSKIQHDHPTSSMNYLGNFNPTNKGLVYHEEKEIHKTIHNQYQRPRFDSVDLRQTHIVDEIDEVSKTKHPHTALSHSHGLKVRRL